MNKFTHVKCLETITEDDILLFQKEKFYKILGTDHHMIYYIEPEFSENTPFLTDEFAISLLDKRFEFLAIK